MLTVLSFIFVLGVLIFIHELGHFLVAKKAGIRVDKFSLGFPPNIIAKKYGETTYCIGLIPLGGYVKMAGESPDEEATGADDEFASKSVGARAAVIFAGPFMNYILAIVLLMAVPFLFGLPEIDPERIEVSSLVEGGPAETAGLLEQDEIIAIDGEPVVFDQVRDRIKNRLEEPVGITWIHNNDTVSASMVTQISTETNPEGGIDSVGIIGFSYSTKVIGYNRSSFFESVEWGFINAHVLVGKTLEFVQKLVTFEVSAKMIGGPVFIAQQSGREAQRGPGSLLIFMALLSVNLAVLNLFPIPILDGGHLCFLLIEKIRGKQLSMNIRIAAQQIGLILLLCCIVYVSYNDILRSFIN